MSLEASESNHEESQFLSNENHGGFTLSEFMPVSMDDDGEDQESSDDDDTKEHLLKTNSCASRIKQNERKRKNSARASLTLPPTINISIYEEPKKALDQELEDEIRPFRQVKDQLVSFHLGNWN